jgi:hypothetical protein
MTDIKPKAAEDKATGGEEFIEHQDPQWKHEFLDAHTITAAHLKELGLEGSLPKELRWDKKNNWRIPVADLTPEIAEALLTDPQFKKVSGK